MLRLCSGEASTSMTLEHGSPLVQRQLHELHAGDAFALQVLISSKDTNLPTDGFCCQLVVTGDHNHLQLCEVNTQWRFLTG